MNELFEIVRPTLITLVTLILGYFSLQFKTWINIKITSEQQAQIIKVAKAAVEFVEQVSGNKIFGEKKLELAKQRALSSLNNIGIKISDEELTMWIEAIVKGMNDHAFLIDTDIQTKEGE
ncbi:phage holin [Erysipelothrix sp. HDW6A]|uniref:phage holin n=1 Tax=Erysipelothrix sp. HDW6A TaxID=2714928 RepID=UPI001407773E|nr:phage holin [Erysipelothrix sp. HDW6A]QIK57760.1 phage holin [Erysipelothrix sp. HDW6A]